MTLAEFPVRLDQPLWLLLLGLLLPAFIVSRKSIGGLSQAKAYVTFTLRALVIAGLAIALAEPSWERRGEGLTLTAILDRSQSMPPVLKRSAFEFIRTAIADREPEDRVGCVIVSREASITQMPEATGDVTVGADDGDPTATDLAAGIELALAIAPQDTANRFIVASDGNETAGDLLAAAELARANGVPIDVLILEYGYDREVIFEHIVVPPRARQGQTARVRMVLHSQAAATGRVHLKVNGIALDLNGDAAGEALPVALTPGTNVFEQIVALDESGPHRFEAVYEPDDAASDVIDQNNTAVGVTFVGGQGKILVVDDGVTDSAFLVQALQESGLTVEATAPGGLEGGLLFLSGYDAVILTNIPLWALGTEVDKALHAYVHDLGGGLVMIGGPQSFGAGGWIDSEVARALPVEMNPPDTRQMPSGALALVMHSCEMAQGNFWGQKVAEAAINALTRLDYVGIVEFNWGGGGPGFEGCAWAFPMQRLGDKAAALNATKTMQVGDMPAFEPSMNLALTGLLGTPAAQRHVIIISDGDPQAPSAAMLQKYVDNKVTCTTVMVGGHGTGADRAKMQAVANKTGGTFYNVTNPKQLPQIFIKEAKIVSRSLIQDGDVYTPAVGGDLPGPTQGFTAVPAIDGYVLTVARAGLAQTPIVIPTKESNDPLFANWNYGLGRAIAFTSSLERLWGSRWAGWERFRAFWEQAVRWVLRPSSPTNMHVDTRFQGDRAIIELEALDADASALNFVVANAVVLRPDLEREAVALQQTGPGRYRGEFRTEGAGAYLVNIGYATGAEGEKGNLQAAVTVPYAREFRSVRHDRNRLEQLAALTGGRVIDARDPAMADLFARGDLEIPKSRKRMWDLLAIIAASVLLIDVAARRISIEVAQVTGLARRAAGRRKEVGEDTVAAWKKARSGVAHRRGPVPAAKGAAVADRGAKFVATAEDEARAIDVGAETPADRGPKPVERAAPAKEAAPADDYTSRLLAAKRRARGEAEGEGGERRDG
jgi:uncharacterized membrane protein